MICGDTSLPEDMMMLGCIAKATGVYLVVNTGDMRQCPDEYPKMCPTAGKMAFNTNVVLSPEGRLVAKYYKHYLFDDHKTTPVPEILGNKVGFGEKGDFIAHLNHGNVHFGVAVCNDINSASTMISYKNLGIDDIIVSDNWENSYSQQSISSISNGFSFAYHINMLVSSAGGGGGGAGGSAIFSNGKTLPNLLNDKNGKPLPSPLNMLMNGATDVPGNYFGPGTEGNPHQDGCIDPSTGKMVFMGGCINLANLATVTTPTPDFSPSNEAVMPKDDVAAWPVEQEPEPGMALVLQKLVESTRKLTPLKFPSVYEDPDSSPGQLAISVLGNVADVTVLAD